MTKKRRARKPRLRPTFRLEDEVRLNAADPTIAVAGVDEVGTGALAGPVFAAAVVLRRHPECDWYADLDDSKRLTHSKREWLYGLVMSDALVVGVGWEGIAKINDIGMALCREGAMVWAYQDVERKITNEKPDGGRNVAAVVDGASLRKNLSPYMGGDVSVFADKADQRSLSVAAASIVAKVTRDREMSVMSTVYGGYELERNKGYGTPAHLAALRDLGPCEMHRVGFAPVKRALERKGK